MDDEPWNRTYITYRNATRRRPSRGHITWAKETTQKVSDQHILKQTYSKRKPKAEPTVNWKNCWHLCVYRCAQLSYTTQHEAVLIIFPLNLRTTITSLSDDVHTGRESGLHHRQRYSMRYKSQARFMQLTSAGNDFRVTTFLTCQKWHIKITREISQRIQNIRTTGLLPSCGPSVTVAGANAGLRFTR